MNYCFVRLNSKLIPIERVEDEHEEARDYEPSFWFNNKRYYLDEFTMCHYNPFVYDSFPDYIHAYEAENYFHPIYIEFVNNCEYVNVYEERELKDE